jgi:hypothetical protein
MTYAEQLQSAFYLVDTVVTLQALCQRSDNNGTLRSAANHIAGQLDGLDVKACDLLYYAFTRGVQQEHAKWDAEMSRRAGNISIDKLIKDARRENVSL